MVITLTYIKYVYINAVLDRVKGMGSQIWDDIGLYGQMGTLIGFNNVLNLINTNFNGAFPQVAVWELNPSLLLN